MNNKKRDKELEKKIQEENEAKIDVLYSRVEEIKNASLEIAEETKSSATFAEHLYSRVQQGTDGITNTFARFDEILENKNNKVTLYVIGLMVISFLLIWKGMLSE